MLSRGPLTCGYLQSLNEQIHASLQQLLLALIRPSLYRSVSSSIKVEMTENPFNRTVKHTKLDNGRHPHFVISMWHRLTKDSLFTQAQSSEPSSHAFKRSKGRTRMLRRVYDPFIFYNSLPQAPTWERKHLMWDLIESKQRRGRFFQPGESVLDNSIRDRLLPLEFHFKTLQPPINNL